MSEIQPICNNGQCEYVSANGSKLTYSEAENLNASIMEVQQDNQNITILNGYTNAEFFGSATEDQIIELNNCIGCIIDVANDELINQSCDTVIVNDSEFTTIHLDNKDTLI